MAIEYNFKYMPLVGKLSGQSMVQQTETAINEIAKIVNDNTAQAEIINTLAEEANDNSVEALEKANEAIATSSRYYVNETAAVNLNDYCEAQLIYINNALSQNLPVAHKGFLEVKTNSDKTQATQVFADNVNRKFYVRTGEITATEVGDVTTYTASYGDWVNIPSSTDLSNYLPVAGGTMNGDIEYSTSDFAIKSNDINNDGQISVVGATDKLNGASLNLYGINHTEVGAFELNANNGTLTKTLKGDASGDLTWNGNITASNFVGNLTGNADTATNATNDGNGNQIDTTYLPQSGGTLTGALNFANNTWNKLGDDSFIGDHNVGGKLCVKSQTSTATGIAFFNNSDTNVGQVEVNNAFNFNKTIQQNGTAVSLSNHNHDSAYASKSVVDNIGTIVSKETTADVSLSADTGKSITNISLVAGKWVITGHAKFTSTAGKQYGIQITTSNNVFSWNSDSAVFATTNSTVCSLCVAKIVSLSSTSTVYLTGRANASVTVPSGCATITAIRIK